MARIKRVVVIGSSCSGKTSFASRLATALGAKHIELDALHWEPNWKEASDEDFRERTSLAIREESWVVDGNYTKKIKDLVWPLADTIVWLDPPLRVILWRFLRRSLSRSARGELLWGHSRETLRNSIFSRNSLLMWILTTRRQKTEAYGRLLRNPPEGAAVFRLRRARQIEEFFRKHVGAAPYRA